MKLKEPKNKNYCATVVEIKALVPLNNCDNVQHAIIMGNGVVVSNETQLGDVGLFFPVETQLSKEYLSTNCLYRHSELNVDNTQKGYFEDSGRIRCVKFRGNKSEGLFMPLDSLLFCGEIESLKIGDEFDELNDIPICCKYIIKQQGTSGAPGSRKGKKPKETKLIDNQFRFHDETNMIYKNLHRINPDDIISISYKMHGTSAISSKILCKKKLNIWNKIGKFLGFDVITTQYDNIYSSRKVIKNAELNPNAQHFYNEDIWGLGNNALQEFLQDGMTIYYEIVGYLPSGSMIQKEYDYGCYFHNPDYYKGLSGSQMIIANLFQIYIYRITYTNQSGKVFEFSFKQVMDWCLSNGLKSVPILYYGYAKDFIDNFELMFAKDTFGSNRVLCKLNEEFDSNKFLERLKQLYTEKQCFMCKQFKVPEEGCVIRIEKNDNEAYKLKSNAFYERETKLLDKGEIDIEENN